MDWETYNIDPNDRKLLDVVVAYGEAFSLKDADGNEVVGGMSAILDDDISPTWDRSHSFAASEGTTSSLQTESVSLLNGLKLTKMFPFPPLFLPFFIVHYLIIYFQMCTL